MKNIKSTLSFVALAVTASLQAQADVRINGFANITAGMTTEDTDYFGVGEDIDFSEGSLFALQVSGDISDKVTATAQILARGSEDYSAEFEWAYLSYAVDENSVVTAGRFRLPVFRYSSSIDVGYSYHWITAPVTVYDVAFNNIDGIRYDYSNYTGDLEYVLQLSYGHYEDEIGGGTNSGDNVVLASVEANYHNFKGRLVWGRGNNVFESTGLDASFNSFLTSLASAVGGEDNIPDNIYALIDDLQIDDDEGVFLGAGLEYDNFDWFVAGEWTRVELEDTFSPVDTAYYVTAGVRLGKWTPHLTYQARDGQDDIKFQDRVASLPVAFQDSAAALNTGLQSSFFEDYSIVTVGVRYDATTNLALKGEVSRYDNKIEPIINSDDTIDTTVLNVSLNYVF